MTKYEVKFTQREVRYMHENGSLQQLDVHYPEAERPMNENLTQIGDIFLEKWINVIIEDSRTLNREHAETAKDVKT